mgnify:CR=1 FL=1
MRFDERQIEFILTIAKEGGISAAAKKLYLSQPALSQRLANLEAELGFKIFRRDVFPMVPTDEGALYLETLEKMRELHRDFQRQLEERQAGLRGSISLALSPMRAQQLLPQLMPLLKRELPGLELQLVHGSDRDSLHALTQEGAADFSVNSRVYPDLAQEEIASATFLLAVPMDHPLALQWKGEKHWEKKGTATLEDVAGDLFLLNYSSQGGRIIAEAYFRESGFAPCRRLELYDDYTIAKLVESGVGVALFADHNAACLIDTLNVSFFRLRGAPRSPVYLSYRKSLYLTPVMRRFMELCKSPCLWAPPGDGAPDDRKGPPGQKPGGPEDRSR